MSIMPSPRLFLDGSQLSVAGLLARRRWAVTVLACLGVAAAYVATGRFGLWLGGMIEGHVSLIWPPTGIALAAVYILGLRVWPGLALGAFVVSGWPDLAALPDLSAEAGRHLLFAAVTALGNPLPSVLTVVLLRLLSRREGLHLRTPRQVVLLIALGGCLTPMVSALIGSVGLVATGMLPRDAFSSVVWSWYVGDAVGAIIIGAPLIALWDSWGHRHWSGSRAELASLLVALLAFWALILRPSLVNSELLVLGAFPFIIWAAVRFDVLVTALVLLAINALSVLALIGGIGPLSAANPALPIQDVQLFMLAVSGTGLVLGVTIAERRRTRRHLDATLAELQRAHEELAHFAYIATHDLQEPLRTIGGFTDLIVRDIGEDASPRLRGHANYVSEGVRHMKRQFQGLMHYALIDASPPEAVPVDLNHALTKAIERCRETHPDVDLAVWADPLPTVRGTPRQFTMLFEHLLDNAARFGGGPGGLRITIRGEVRGRQATITFQDRGAGFDPAFRKDAFLLFRRMRRDLHPEGAGVGLAVVRRIVARHGGAIRLSEDEAGAGFVITLPLDFKPWSEDTQQEVSP